MLVQSNFDQLNDFIQFHTKNTFLLSLFYIQTYMHSFSHSMLGNSLPFLPQLPSAYPRLPVGPSSVQHRARAAPLPLGPSRPLPGGATARAVCPLLRVTAAARPAAIATHRLACGPRGDGGGRLGSSRARYGLTGSRGGSGTSFNPLRLKKRGIVTEGVVYVGLLAQRGLIYCL